MNYRVLSAAFVGIVFCILVFIYRVHLSVEVQPATCPSQQAHLKAEFKTIDIIDLGQPREYLYITSLSEDSPLRLLGFDQGDIFRGVSDQTILCELSLDTTKNLYLRVARIGHQEYIESDWKVVRTPAQFLESIEE